jgi:hypothetical protein
MIGAVFADESEAKNFHKKVTAMASRSKKSSAGPYPHNTCVV